jgi:hypothetical protein
MIVFLLLKWCGMGGKAHKMHMLRCSHCHVTRSITHFPRGKAPRGSMEKAVCSHCKRQCAHCTAFFVPEKMSANDPNLCQMCSKRKGKAVGNVFFRYPMLKHLGCPMPAQKYRETLAEERLRVD